MEKKRDPGGKLSVGHPSRLQAIHADPGRYRLGISPSSATVTFHECVSHIPDPGAPKKIAVDSKILRSQTVASGLPALLIHCLEKVLDLVQALIFSSVKQDHYKSASWDYCDDRVEIPSSVQL